MRFLRVLFPLVALLVMSCSLFQSGSEIKYKITGGPARVREVMYLSGMDGSSETYTLIKDVALPWEKTVYIEVKKGDKVTLSATTYGVLDQIVLEIYVDGELKVRREGMSYVSLEYEVE